MPADLKSLLQDTQRALVIGIGGGGDIAGTVPTLDLLSLCNVAWVAGGLTWERIVYDPKPGPRPIADLVYASPFAPCAAPANAHTHTRTADGVTFAESAFASVFNCETVLIGIDVGGDALAMGNEPGLRSPLADASMLAALAELQGEDVPAILGVLGYGSDGELTPVELDARVAAIAASGGYLGAWGMTQRAVADMERLFTQLRSEASQIPLHAARGGLGRRPIRDGAAEVVLGPVSTITFYLDPATTVRETAVPAQRVAGSTSLDQANEALHARGLRDYRREGEFQKDARRAGSQEE